MVDRVVRAFVILVLGANAHADPETTVRDEVTRDGVRPALETTLRMRSEGASGGIGVGARFGHGDFALTLGVTRWQTIDWGSGSQGSWEIGARSYRYLNLGPRTRAYVLAGASYEAVERDDRAFGRTNLVVGGGLSTRLADGIVGWTQLTLEQRHWIDSPGTEDNELAVMLMFGLSL